VREYSSPASTAGFNTLRIARKKDKLRALLSFVYPTAEGLSLKDGALVEYNV